MRLSKEELMRELEEVLVKEQLQLFNERLELLKAHRTNIEVHKHPHEPFPYSVIFHVYGDAYPADERHYAGCRLWFYNHYGLYEFVKALSWLVEIVKKTTKEV